MSTTQSELPPGPKVTCRECKKQVHYLLADLTSRQGGGTYRRGGRFYRGQACVTCVERALTYAMVSGGRIVTSRTTHRWSVSSLLRALTAFLYRDVTDLDEDRWRAQYHRQDPTFEEFWAALTTSIADEQVENLRAAERARTIVRATLTEGEPS